MSENGALAENKLILLYLLQKMNIALSNDDICQFVMEHSVMDYFLAQQYLTQLVDTKFLEESSDNGTTRYHLTDSGREALGFFGNRISSWLKNAANEYIANNKSRIKSDYETSANYFPEINGEYLVKCAVCALDGTQIMEVDVVVPTKKQAQIICTNWKQNVNHIVSDIFASLIGQGKCPRS